MCAERRGSFLDALDVTLTGGLPVEHHRTRFGAPPRGLAAADYLATDGAATVAVAADAVPPTPWEPALVEAVRTHRQVVFEGQVLDVLPGDLT